MEDEQIIELFWRRSENAITETSKKHGAYCTYIAFNILQNIQDSEECVNDTWLKAWQSMPPRRPSRLPAFLGKITRNLSLNRYKANTADKRGGGQLTLAYEELSECVRGNQDMEHLEERELIVAVLNKFLAALSKRDRQVFVRRYWYFSPVDEIAREYGLSRSNAKMILSRTRAKLKAALEQEGIIL
ncbi:MAG: sigma-70 family RNA polymerase sigma factor [Roseburia sp.]|nr:sigma-70 family RNA polymerase sigma factor [Lachnospiraceae bacterium]MCM1568876.1 sigma-70 family RNA polymerase sigma factor [Roseburia sp.]